MDKAAIPLVSLPILEPSPTTLLRRRIFGHAGLLIGSAVLITIVLMALFAPWIAPHDPFDQVLDRKLIPPIWSDADKATWTHPLGTDHFGRDYLSRLIWGARISLLIGLSAMLISGIIGTVLGVLAGFFGGRVDMVANFLITTRLSMPVVLVAIAVVSLVGSSLTVVIWVLGLLIWDRFAVVMRSATMQVRNLDFVAAAQALGCSTARIVSTEILPNIANHLIVVATIEMAHAILLEAALSFLGLGVQPPAPSWGLMISEAKGLMFFDGWLIAIPGTARSGGGGPVGTGAGAGAGAMAAAPILEVESLSVDIPVPAGMLHPVQEVGFRVERGRTLAIVGESGCGKSLTSLALMNLLPARAKRTAGRLALDGRDLLDLSEREMSDIRGNRMSMIFQEPMTSLNPAYTVGDQLVEAERRHRRTSAAQARARAVWLLEKVGMTGAEGRLRQYPHQLSGGLRQRVMIAMALMCEPDVIIADEPTTALDVTIQAQILHLLADLQREFETGLILITHDLGVVARLCDRVAVMYAGQIVEEGTARRIFQAPAHPYTRGLLECIPIPGKTRRGAHLGTIPGIVPSLVGAMQGCHFAERCPHVSEACRAEPVAFRHGNEAGHRYRCVLPPGYGGGGGGDDGGGPGDAGRPQPPR